MKRSAFLAIFLLFALSLFPTLASAHTILVFGDSLSAGYGVPREKSWVSLLRQQLKQHHPQYSVVNASISGETANGARWRLEPALKLHKPAVVILELGANDGLRGMKIDGIREDLDYMLRLTRDAGTKVLLVGMQLPPNYGIDYAAKFKALYPALAQQYHTALVPFLLAGVTPEQYQADNLHPAAAAQPQLLHNILQQLEPLLIK